MLAMRTPRDEERLAEFGRRVRQRRKALGMSQESFAEIVGVHRTYISSVERGLRNATLTVIWRLAQGLDCDAGDLCGHPDVRN